MAGKVIQLLACVCFLKMITIGNTCSLVYWSQMSMEEHLYHADIVVLAYVTDIPAGFSFAPGDGLFKVLCIFKDDGSPVQADITITDIKRGGESMCHGEYGNLMIGSTWIVALRRTSSGHYEWHEVEALHTAAWNNTQEHIQKVVSVCGLQNWAAPLGVNMKDSDCPNMQIPATCINEDWRMNRQNLDCEWARNQWNDSGEFVSDRPCPTKEVQTMDCTCDTQPWTDWIRSSMAPCIETRSRGEIRTVQICVWERLGRQPTSNVFNCIETRDCESIVKLPCDDSSGLHAVVGLCATSITGQPLANQLRNVKNWRALCQDENDGIESAITCLRKNTHCTENEAEALLSTGAHCFYVMMCDKGALNPEIQTMLDHVRFDQDAIDVMDFSPCLKPLIEPNPDLRKLMYVPALSCMRDVIEQAHLTEPNSELARLMAQFLIDCTALIDNLGPTSKFYDFRSPRCNMRIWGEPHIETCNDTVTQTTCAAPGLQTYLDIYFLKITGENTHPDRGGPVTFLSEVTIEFKSLAPPHALTARYKAEHRNLPATFEYLADQVSEIDSVSLSMDGSRPRSVGGLLFAPVLVWPHTGIEIILNIWGSFYQLTMRASQAVMNTGTGILIQGCPEDQVLPLWSGLPPGLVPYRRRRNIPEISKRDEDKASARAACLAEYIPPDTADMDACMFDVIAMNDTTIAGSTSMSLVDKDMIVGRDEDRIQTAGVWSLDIPAGPGFQYCIVGADVAGCRKCVPNELLQDPTDCSRYYHCLGYQKAMLRECPRILHFNTASGRCDWPWRVRCQVVPAGNGP